MPWQTDGRTGVASIGATQREGFALLRDAEKGLVAFHARLDTEVFDPSNPRPRPESQFVIPEAAFRETPHSSDKVLGKCLRRRDRSKASHAGDSYVFRQKRQLSGLNIRFQN